MPERPAPMISTSKCSAGWLVSMCPISAQSEDKSKANEKAPECSGASLCLSHSVLRNLKTQISIPILIRLERAFGLHADIIGLVLAQRGELHADLGEVQA